MEKKKMKLWPKIVLGVLAVVIVLLTIIVMVNNSIINKIVAKQKENVNRQNYSYTVQSNSSENTMTKIYYKDGTRIYVIQNNDRSAIMWSDSNTKEMIAMVPNTLKATIEKYDGYDLASIPYLLDEAMSRILKFSSIITSDTVNGEECYKVSSLGQKLWFSKSTGMIVKEMNGTVVKDGKEKFDIEKLRWCLINSYCHFYLMNENNEDYKNKLLILLRNCMEEKI